MVNHKNKGNRIYIAAHTSKQIGKWDTGWGDCWNRLPHSPAGGIPESDRLQQRMTWLCDTRTYISIYHPLPTPPKKILLGSFCQGNYNQCLFLLFFPALVLCSENMKVNKEEEKNLEYCKHIRLLQRWKKSNPVCKGPVSDTCSMTPSNILSFSQHPQKPL